MLKATNNKRLVAPTARRICCSYKMVLLTSLCGASVLIAFECCVLG